MAPSTPPTPPPPTTTTTQPPPPAPCTHHPSNRPHPPTLPAPAPPPTGQDRRAAAGCHRPSPLSRPPSNFAIQAPTHTSYPHLLPTPTTHAYYPHLLPAPPADTYYPHLKDECSLLNRLRHSACFSSTGGNGGLRTHAIISLQTRSLHHAEPTAQVQCIESLLWQLAAKVICLAFVFSPALALLFPIGTIFCLSANLIDTHAFLRVVRPPPRAHSLRVMYSMVCWWMPIAVMGRLGYASLVYYSLPCGCDAEGSPLLRPVQYIVLFGAAALAIPVACFIAREAVLARAHGFGEVGREHGEAAASASSCVSRCAGSIGAFLHVLGSPTLEEHPLATPLAVEGRMRESVGSRDPSRAQ